MDARARALFENGHDAVRRGDTEAAIAAFRAAAAQQPDLTDAYVWLAKLAADEKSKRDHLSEVIARDPSHGEALRMLMLLNGRLTEAEIAATRGDDPAPDLQSVSDSQAQTQILRCPVCGGDLTTDIENRRVICRHCGHEAPLSMSEDRAGNLTMALLERRAKPVRWRVEGRILHCNSCAATRSLPSNRLAERCPFCGSQHVIIQDSYGTITQPDGVVPFTVSEDEARSALFEKLKSVSERVAGFFGDNRVSNLSLEGVYLPFWVFDALIQVTVTKQLRDMSGNTNRAILAAGLAVQRDQYQDGETGIAIPAFAASSKLAKKLGEFELDFQRPYDPALLASYGAQLYDVDFDRAALDAREFASRRARERAKVRVSPLSDFEITTSSFVQQMSFQLVLFPVWVAMLYERDGDQRPALVHGQTGAVALGAAQKPA